MNPEHSLPVASPDAPAGGKRIRKIEMNRSTLDPPNVTCQRESHICEDDCADEPFHHTN